MRRVAWFLVMVTAPAWAQDVGERAEVVDDVSSLRFVGESVPGPDLRAGQRITVVAAEGDSLRVMAGDRLGWVARGAIRPIAELPPVEPGTVETP